MIGHVPARLASGAGGGARGERLDEPVWSPARRKDAGGRPPSVLTWMSPAVMTVALTAWLLFWHHSLILALGFSPNDFREFMRLLAVLYVLAALAFSLGLHAALWRYAGSARRTKVVLALAATVFMISGVARALDWGTFYYAASHVDDDFWASLFYRQNFGFASSQASWWPVIGVLAAAGGFALLLRQACRFARLAPGTGRPLGSRLRLNAAAALAVVAFAHLAWFVLIPPPARDIGSGVRAAFAAVPEYKVIAPLVTQAIERAPERPEMDAAFIAKLARAGVRLNTIDPAYPLMKPSVYVDPANRSATTPAMPPGTNLIVVIAESLSSALLDERVHGVKDLTPNFADFAKHAYTFRNLYSADFPTIKGQIATLASFAFDHRGLSTRSKAGNPLQSGFLFLSDVLKQRGYATIHAQSDFGTFAGTKAIFGRHHYDWIRAGEDRDLVSASSQRGAKTWGLFDEDLFHALARLLDAGALRQPFLLTVATTDLHFPYTNLYRHPGTSGNEMLDAVYTEDHAFGVFWKAFKQSPWAANTMVLLTADHALVRQAIRRGGADPKVSEFDYVTGILYLPAAGWAGRGTDVVCTQLDITPTLLDVLGIDVPNPFLGLSIFSERPRYPLALGRDVPLDRLSRADRAAADAIGWTPDDQARYMALLRYLAVANRIRK